MACSACQKSGVAMTTASDGPSPCRASRGSPRRRVGMPACRLNRRGDAPLVVLRPDVAHRPEAQAGDLRGMASSSTCPWAPAPISATRSSLEARVAARMGLTPSDQAGSRRRGCGGQQEIPPIHGIFRGAGIRHGYLLNGKSCKLQTTSITALRATGGFGKKWRMGPLTCGVGPGSSGFLPLTVLRPVKTLQIFTARGSQAGSSR